MKLIDNLYDIWTYAAYGEKHIDTSIGHSQGLDMFLRNLRSGCENYPDAGVALDWEALSADWNAMTASQQGEQLDAVKETERKHYTELAACFRSGDRAGFDAIVDGTLAD